MFRKWSEAKPVQAGVGTVRRTMAVGEKTLLVEWSLEQGHEVPLHQHEYEQIGYVVSGCIEMRIGEEMRRLEPGDGYVALANVPHGAAALVDSKVIDIFSPVRPDYA